MELRFRIIHHADQATVDRMYREYAPVFVLSTGRSGTKLAAALLGAGAGATSFHEPTPALMHLSNHAFHHQEEVETLRRIVDAARTELVLTAYIAGKTYVESNQCLSFFAPAIAGLFKGARFVHLVRHPGDFVRSAIRKGWHRNDTIWESGRVRMADASAWGRLDQIEKLSWVWATTTRYLVDLKTTLGADRVHLTRLEDLVCSPDTVSALFRFAGIGEPDEGEVSRFQSRRMNELEIAPDEPPNMRKVSSFPAYPSWPSSDKDKVRLWCAELASDLGFDLE